MENNTYVIVEDKGTFALRGGVSVTAQTRPLSPVLDSQSAALIMGGLVDGRIAVPTLVATSTQEEVSTLLQYLHDTPAPRQEKTSDV